MAVLLVLFLAAGAQTAMNDAPVPSYASHSIQRDASGYDR